MWAKSAEEDTAWHQSIRKPDSVSGYVSVHLLCLHLCYECVCVHLCVREQYHSSCQSSSSPSVKSNRHFSPCRCFPLAVGIYPPSDSV